MRREQVCGRWVHAHEEDSGQEMVFRPADTDLPPSRGRTTIELRPDGTFVGGGPGVDDVPQESPGSWSLEGERITLSPSGGGSAARRLPTWLDVVTAEQDRLVVRRGATGQQGPAGPGQR